MCKLPITISKKQSNEGGFSFIEIVVASVIFSITTVGVLTTFSLLRQPAKDTDKKLQASYMAERLLEELRSQVDASTWNTAGGSLDPNTAHSFPGFTDPATGITYTGYSYTVTEDPTTKARTVNLTLNW